LVRAALQLWTERGFENGVEETTVEEIVKVAGVTKGTFYFHFARKEEILLEMAWETAGLVNAEAVRCVKAERTLEDSMARLIGLLANRVRAAPPAATARSVLEFRRRPPAERAADQLHGFGHGFEIVFAQAQKTGELPSDLSPLEMAKLFQLLAMDAIVEWADSHNDLREALRIRAGVLVGGLKAPAILP
jgi:AcrR family transcriptional regulator